MRILRPFIPSLAMLLLATSGAAAQGVLIDRSEIRFVSKQMGVSVEGRFRKWKASVDWRPDDLAHSKADFEIDLASIDLASEESEAEVRRSGLVRHREIPARRVPLDLAARPRRRPLRDRGRALAERHDAADSHSRSPFAGTTPATRWPKASSR